VAVERPFGFGWLLDGDGGTQAAYQIQVHRGSALVWDSGRVASSEQAYVPYGGADLATGGAHSWRVRVWGAAGGASSWAGPAPFGAGLRDGDWEASWIARTPEDEHDRRDRYTLLRRELVVPDGPVLRAVVYVASYHQHELRIDGRAVCRGPAFAHPDEGYYQAADVTELLRPGARVALGAITHWYGPGQGRPEASPGLLVRLVVDHADGGSTVVVTDGSWRVARGPWLAAPYRNGDGRDYVEHVDGRAEPPGWDRPGFDDAAWQSAQELGVHPTPVFSHLQAQEVGLTFSTAAPIGVTPTGTGGVLADFGRVMAAVPVVRFEAGRAGREVSMAAGYLADGAEVSRTAGTQETDMSYRYVQRDGAQAFEPFTYLGFRYLQVDDSGEALGDGSIAAVEQHTDVDRTRAATFACSDPTLTAVFELAMRSALVCSQWQFLDTPTREKGQFLADAVNISRALMGGFGDRALTRKAIGEFVASQRRYWPDGRLNAVYPNGDGRRDIPDFTELFCGWVWGYFMETGDRLTLEAAHPAMEAICGYLLRHRDPRTGLVTDLAGGSGPYRGGIVDWPATMRFGFDMDVSARTTVNVLAVDALRTTAMAGAALDRPAGGRERLVAHAADLAADIDARLRREDGIYVDGLHADLRRSDGVSQIANAYPLALGLVDGPSRERVGRHVAGLGMRMGPMTAGRLLDALAACGRIDQVVARIADREAPGWANVLARGGTCTWESWDAPETGTSLSHAWGADVLVAIQRHLLGVTVTGPGAARVAIRPALGVLPSAEGSVPTQRGAVSVGWDTAPGGAVSLRVVVPANMEAGVHLPGEVPRAASGRTEFVVASNRTVDRCENDRYGCV
jgi:alpha-L-rhamnosidase